MYSEKNIFNMKFSLNCLLLGEVSERSISVDISDITLVGNNKVKYEDFKVSHVKSLILSGKGISCSLDHLNLWKVDRVSVNKNDKVLETFSTEDDIKEKLGGELMQPRFLLDEYFDENRFKDKESKSAIHIIVQPLTDIPNKRIKLKDLNLEILQQRTTQYLQDLLLPFDEPVSRDNIEQYLNTPLRKKLPALYYESTQFPSFLDNKESDYIPEVTAAVTVAMELFKDKKNQEMETSYMVDNIIRKMFKLVEDYISDSGFEWARNNKVDEYTTTSSKKGRPDVLAYCKNVLVMMGEEKAAHATFRIAARELDTYFNFWNTLAFGNIPLIISFAAVGSQIQFYYYYVVESSDKPIREALGDVLSLGSGRKLFNIKALQYTINIIRIIRTFDECDLIQTPSLKLYNEIYRDNSTITIYPTFVRKKIERVSIVDEEFHKELYTILSELGHLMVIKYSATRNMINLTFGPVGFLRIPKSEGELRHAISDMLEIVCELHNKSVVHRDIRWENFVKLIDDRWLLIDFEEAAKIGETRDTLRIAAPEYENKNDLCRASGDIWMIGKLMDDYRIKFTLSERAQEFRERLMREDPNQRPTAADAIKDDWLKE